MEEYPKVVERQDLYAQVWAKPMTKLAKEYGISDVALTKACKKANIPLPGRGYWAKVAVGRVIKPPPLPAISSQDSTTISIGAQKARTRFGRVVETCVTLPAVKTDAEEPIQVPARLGKLHPILAQLSQNFKEAKPDKYGALWSQELKTLNLRVSKDSLSRALRILNALYRALESRGYPITLQKGERSKVVVTILGETLEFGVEEKFQRLERDPKDPQKRTWWDWERFYYRATGNLALKICEYTWDQTQKIWSDGKRQRVETQLNAFIRGLIQVAESEKAQRLRREREEQERREAEHRRQLLEQKRLEEEAKCRHLEQEAAHWHKAQQIRTYLAAVRERVSRQENGEEPNPKIEEWLAWAHRYADHLDPLSKS